MFRFALTALALALASPVAAQNPLTPSPTYPVVHVEQWGNDDEPDPARLRRASMGRDVGDWLRLDDPEIQTQVLYGDPGSPRSHASLSMEITPEGRLGSCRVTWSSGDRRWPTNLCERLRDRVRFRPAIDIDGRPTRDVVLVTLEYGVSPEPTTSLVRIGSGAPPVMAATDPRAWPPAPGPRASVSGMELVNGGPDAPEAINGPWSGVVVEPDKTGRRFTCEVKASSGDADFDRRACAAAEAGGYNFSFLHQSRRRIGLLFVLQDGVPKVLLPGESVRDAMIENASMAEIAERLMAAGHDIRNGPTAYVRVGPDGQGAGCRITRSSGSDALDVAACRLLRSEGRYTIARDVFGRPVEDSVPIRFPPVL